MTTTLPEVGEVVVLKTYESDPWLLVCATNDDAQTITGTLLADLAHETVLRIAASIGDRPRRRRLTEAVRRADLRTLEVPVRDYRHRGGPGIQGCSSPAPVN
ncbi:hypothetical protein EGH21_21865 [Halomicroarcula sp. F13]|uniref:Uncharacterized protein n=1 Tax=Haloarcula rubra TaxID=2487747 RepID=A0AAW4PWX2_9EURY|nr:hypothetical protein [Halomicroarcula rubra]MBX0325667.1 hypothetical protein [Halomicroarcula rubra]